MIVVLYKYNILLLLLLLVFYGSDGLLFGFIVLLTL